MEKPERPLPSDCCETGCNICVFDIYADRKKAYNKWKSLQLEKDDSISTTNKTTPKNNE